MRNLQSNCSSTGSLVEHDEIRAHRDRAREDVADRRGVLYVLAQLLELLGRGVRRPDPAPRPDRAEPCAWAAESEEAVEVEVALDLVAELLDLDAPGGCVVRVADGVA